MAKYEVSMSIVMESEDFHSTCLKFSDVMDRAKDAFADAFVKGHSEAHAVLPREEGFLSEPSSFILKIEEIED